MEGIRDYEFLKKNTSYLIVEVSPCDDGRLTLEQKARGVKCKSKEEIKKWRADKNLLPDVLDAQPNLVKGDDLLIHAEKWMTSVQLREGVFTD